VVRRSLVDLDRRLTDHERRLSRMEWVQIISILGLGGVINVDRLTGTPLWVHLVVTFVSILIVLLAAYVSWELYDNRRRKR